MRTRHAAALALSLALHAAGQDGRDAYLDELAQAANAIPPGKRDLALARVALANARVGRAAQAIELAQLVAAAKRAGTDAQALAGAALRRAGKQDDGATLLRTALDRIVALEPSERATALTPWLQALAEAPDQALLTRGWETLRALPTDRQAVVIKYAWAALRDLGADEFSIPCVVIALRGEKDVWRTARENARLLDQNGNRFAALLVRLSAVFRLIEDRHPSAGDRLESTIESAWGFPPKGDGAMQRMRVLYRLYPKIAEALPADRALEVIAREQQRAVENEKESFVLNELLGHLATAAEKLDAAAAGPVLTSVLDRTLRAHEAATLTPALLFESMAECVRVSAVHGESKRTIEIAEQVAGRANEAIAAIPVERRDDAMGGPVFFPVKALFACSRAARKLGDAERADRWLEAGLLASVGTDKSDRADLLVDAFATTAEIQGPARTAAARKVLGVAKEVCTECPRYEIGDLFKAAVAVMSDPG